MWKSGRMSKVIDTGTDGVSLPEFVRPERESGNLEGVLKVAADGAVALARGPVTSGLLLARNGTRLAKSVLARRADSADSAGSARRAATDGGRGRGALLTAGILGAVVVGGAVFYRSRRPAFPPVAPEPPRVRPVSSPAESDAQAPTEPDEN